MNASAGHSDGTVGKALDVLDAVALAGRPVKFAELLAEGRWPKATLYRLLQTLTNQGMLALDPDTGAYTPGLRLVSLAHKAWSQTSIAPVARPSLDALSAKLGQTVHLAQLDHGQVLYVDKRNAHKPIEMFSGTGKVGPAYCTGVGKAMLAFLADAELAAALKAQAYQRHTPATHTSADSLRTELSEIRETGLSFDREEHEPGIFCVAAPILGLAGNPLGALSITSSTLQHELKDLAALAPDLKATASEIAARLQPWANPIPAEEA
ncbi:MAG: IclR family transcriptional regulator [Pseudomonadota bacterium]